MNPTITAPTVPCQICGQPGWIERGRMRCSRCGFEFCFACEGSQLLLDHESLEESAESENLDQT